MKTRYWILLFLAVLLLCAAAAWHIENTKPSEALAGVYQNGRLVRTVDLSAVTEPYDIVLTEAGSCDVRVEPGKIYILSSTCPDQLCVKHGPLGGGLPVACLPNKVVIRWLSETDKGYDAMTDAVN
ncbi:MAG: NusG domain II-containing protein [Bacillota bacterium]